jgi:hypothetical protein
MSKMKRLLEEICESEDEILALIEQAKEKRPLFYEQAKKYPSYTVCMRLFNGLTDDDKLITMGYFYMNM